MKKSALVLTATIGMGAAFVTAAWATRSIDNRESAAIEQSALHDMDGEIRLAEARRMQLGKCAEGYSASIAKVEGKNVVYECTMSLRCEGKFKATQYEVVVAGGHIIQHYRCSKHDSKQDISLPAPD